MGATVVNGTKVSIKSNQIPSDYTAPSVTTFTDHEYTRTLTLSILKSTVQNADPATTLAAIIANATIGIEKQITDIITADIDTAAVTPTYWANWTSLSSNVVANATSDFLTATAMSYVVTVKVYVKTA